MMERTDDRGSGALFRALPRYPESARVTSAEAKVLKLPCELLDSMKAQSASEGSGCLANYISII